MKPLILTLIFAVIATTIGAGWAISEFHSRINRNQPENNQNLMAYKQLGQAIGKTLDDFAHREEFVSHWKNKNGIDISFQDRALFLVPDNLAQQSKNGEPLLLESAGEMSLHYYLQTSNQVMSIVLPINKVSQPVLLNTALTLLFYLLVILVLLAWLYPLIRRLMKLQKTANQLGTGDLSSRVKTSQFSYISSIENDFNRMANQIQNLVDDNRLLSRAVSHNLKTPITRLRMGIDVLEEKKDESELDKYIKRINYDLDEMESLVNTLLHYSSLDEFNLQLKKEPIDLREFIPKLIENEISTSIKVKTSFPNDSVIINTDPQYFAMCLTNILANAVQHAKSTVKITIDLKNKDTLQASVSINVEDDGTGISERDLPHVTKPFWRSQNNTGTNGHGMGLAIVDRISQWLNAEFSIGNSTLLGGASVHMLFPGE